jgi:hypothetical protein
MKHSLKYYLLSGVVATIGITSCQKKLDEAYANPNAAVKVPVETILPSMIGNIVGSSAAAGSAYGIANDGLLVGRYIQYWGTNAASAPSASSSISSNYDLMGGTVGSSDNLGSVWAAHYFGMGQNINRMIDWATEEQKWDFVGAGWALRAWSMMEATNEYGDIVLKEAFNASQQVFHYDEQSEVYDSVRAICYRSLIYLNKSEGNMGQKFAESDAYFNGGDLNKWKKFVYGILARSYAYISNKPSLYKPDSVIKYADLASTSNADNITVKFAATGISGTSNYYGPFRGNVGTIRQAAYIADLMSGNNPGIFTGVFDPRVWYILRENPNGTFKGIIPWKGATGLSTGDQPQNFWGNPYSSSSSPSTDQGRYLFRDNAEFPIMTASEMQFLKAEAAYKKGDKATALAAYTNGISLNFDMLATKYAMNVPAANTINSTNKGAYMSNTAVVPTDVNALTLSMIMLQKYIALYGWGVLETWVDLRRYHYTDTEAATGKQVYTGFTPPTSDLFINNNGKLVYRSRPRYNSEYLYNIPELKRIGALELDYHTKPTWIINP